MTKGQLIIANMLKKAGRKVTVIDAAKALSPAQIADEQERERQTYHPASALGYTCKACDCKIDRYGGCGCNPPDA